MKKLILILVLTLFMACNVKAANISVPDIEPSTYIVGKYMFTRNMNDETGYDGVLTTRRIMLAAKTIESNEEEDMIIYYKTSRGVWIDALSGENVEVEETLPISKIDLEAVKFTVSFNTNGGTTIQGQEVEENDVATRPSNPTKTGHTFKEWQLNGSTYNFATPVTGDITLDAVYDVNNYTVTFDSNGGTSVASQTIEYNHNATKPSNPTKTGYDFAEWQLNGATYNFETPVTGNITLTAVYNVKTYTVTFDSNGGTSVAPQTIEYNHNATKPSNPTKTGYDFAEWQLNGATYNFETPITGDITLKAAYNVKTYTVTFNANGGTSVASQTIEHGQTATKPSNPTRSGYKFVRWLLNSNEYNFGNQVTADITLLAEWEEQTYQIVIRTIDQYSPDRELSVLLNGEEIEFKEIRYDSYTICTYNNPTANAFDLEGITSFEVVLTDDTVILATVA